jgi:predicted HTH domain antitoxin
MGKNSVTIELPKAIKGTKLEQKYLVTAKETIHELTVLRLFEQGEISSGYGAELLGITRHEFMSLLGKRGIPYFNFSDSELKEELQAASASIPGESKPV